MNIYLISQSENLGYDTYDSAVVIAEDEYAARCVHPSDYYVFINNKSYFKYSDGRLELQSDSAWVDNPYKVDVEFIGTASEDSLSRVVCTSFNAG